MGVEERLKENGWKLPPAPKPVAIYYTAKIFGGNCWTSGHGPVMDNRELMYGRVGDTVDQEFGVKAARQTGLAILSSVKQVLDGDLDRILCVMRIFGMVNCVPDFKNHPIVINGCSELFVALFGEENGKGVRSAVGMGSLPGNIPVEIEAIFEIKP